MFVKVRSVRSFALVLSLGLCAVVSTTGCADDSDAPSSENEATGEDMFTVDIPKSEALLAKAVKMAERHDQGHVCDEDVYISYIVDTLRSAIKVRDTVWFRTRVIAKKPILVKVLADTLEWQEILGTFKPTQVNATLPAAFSAGVSLWDTNGGAYGNQRRLELNANGKAVMHQLDTESPDFHWNATPTTWKYEGGKLKLGTGQVWTVKYANGMLNVGVVPGTGGVAEFISWQSECSA